MGGSAMQATQQQLSDAKIDLAYRDFCAHLLIPLNECRKRSYFLPWKCEHERHVYEKCQYKECVTAPRPRRGVTQPLKIRHRLAAEKEPTEIGAGSGRLPDDTRRSPARRRRHFSPRPKRRFADGAVPRFRTRYMMRVSQQKAASGAH